MANDEIQPVTQLVNSELDASSLEELHPIKEAISRYIHKIRDIKWGGRVFASDAAQKMHDRVEKAVNQINDGERLLASNDETERIHGIKAVQEGMRKLERFEYSVMPELIESSLFLSLFSTFDAYTGELLAGIYARKPQLFDKLDRKIDLVDVLTARSIEELKKSVLESEIEKFRRKSYVEQFEELESTFGLKLKAFDRWADFVECSQRRNLLTHCDGIVSDQYIKMCKEVGYPEQEIASLGTQLKLGPTYFLATCELMIEVGLKLGQTLWRKILPEELEEADDHMHSAQFDALNSQNWPRAIVMGEFAINLPKHSSELQRRICTINYCIALKFSGDEVKALEVLSKMDWSASISDFQLAAAVLRDQFDDAARIMGQIGKKGQLVNETAYHIWPLFNAFRESPQFISSYEKIYGHPFIVELKRAADAAITEASSKENIINAEPVEKNFEDTAQ